MLLTVSILTSCTDVEQAETFVNCPCSITEIKYYDGMYNVKAKSIKNGHEYFTFYTTTTHQIGDKIE